MKLRFVGETFGHGFAGLTNGRIYECIGVEYTFVRVIDDEGEDYLYSAIFPGPANGLSPPGKWEIIEDDENETLKKAMERIWREYNNSTKN